MDRFIGGMLTGILWQGVAMDWFIVPLLTDQSIIWPFAEPTAEALAWLERALELEGEGVLVGARELCRLCYAPIRGWGVHGNKGMVRPCKCGTKPAHPGKEFDAHGLESIRTGAQQHGATTYG